MRLIAIGGSDAGISAALRARELDPSAEVTVVLADSYPNFSICGSPYYISREVSDWRNLAHRTLGDLGTTYLPLGTTAHKQGRIAGENATGGSREFAGSLATQVVRVFDAVAARTGLRDNEAEPAGFEPLTVASQAEDHKAYYPVSHPIHMRYTGDRRTGQLLGLQLAGRLGPQLVVSLLIA